MNVRLIAVTQSSPELKLEGISTAEDLMVYCARVSNPSNQLNTNTGAKLLTYCIKHGHWSVFEQASMTVAITTSRAIAQQILRHRSFSFQEFSQRYATATAFEPVELRVQGTTNRQGGEELLPPNTPVVLLSEDVVSAECAVTEVVEYCQHVYDSLIKAGVAKECARMVLPLCTQTQLYMTGTVRSWLHYLQVRSDLHTQKEHRAVAAAVWRLFKEQFPITAGAFGLERRSREQQLDYWVKGQSIHNLLTDECCPDFSCCNPDLKEHEDSRKTYAANWRQRIENEDQETNKG